MDSSVVKKRRHEGASRKRSRRRVRSGGSLSWVESFVSASKDLLLWYSAVGPTADLLRFVESRSRPGSIAAHTDHPIPKDWSDSHYAKNIDDLPYRKLLNLGVPVSSFFHAQANGCVDKGRISQAKDLCARTQLPLQVLQQLFDLSQAQTVDWPLSALFRGDLEYRQLSKGVVLPFVRSLAGRLSHRPPFDIAIVVPWLETGGAELEAYWIYAAAEALGMRPLLVLTQTAVVTKFYSDRNLEIINLPSLFENRFGSLFSALPMEIQTTILMSTLTMAGVRITHVVHSWTAYSLLLQMAWAKPQAVPRPFKVLVSAFCPHIHADGRVDGYFRLFPEIDSIVEAYVFDDSWYSAEIKSLFGISDSRRITLSFPVESVLLTEADTRRRGESRVLWASRLDFQKNPEIVFKIAEQLPQVQFHMFGRQVLNDISVDWTLAPENVIYCGEFFQFADIPIRSYDLFLYTARFDGMPNIILESAASGMPMVSSPVGGIKAFFADGAGLLVKDPDDVNGYVESIRRILNDRRLRMSVRRKAMLKIQRTRSFEQFSGALFQIPAYKALLRER